MKVNWQEVRLVVFDVDGTLYDQRCLRWKMIRELLGYCLRHPGDVGILRQISLFRRCREDLAEEESEGIDDLQYLRPATKLGLEPDQIRRTAEEWLIQRPLGHLRPCRYAKVADFMAGLRESGRVVAVLSDYPATGKLRALGLDADLVVSAMDPEVNRLKPHPRGLQRVLELTGMKPTQALLIGDREDRDGECARRAGMACLLKVDRVVDEEAQFSDFADLVGSLHPIPAEDAALQ